MNQHVSLKVGRLVGYYGLSLLVICHFSTLSFFSHFGLFWVHRSYFESISMSVYMCVNLVITDRRSLKYTAAVFDFNHINCCIKKLSIDLKSRSYYCFFKKLVSIVLPRSPCLHDTIINIRAKINCVRHQTAGEINIKFICNSYKISFNISRTKKLMRYGKPLQ